MFEYEKKLLLSESEYERLMSLSGQALPSYTQINHYYDTDDLRLNACGITCRIRERNGKFVATVKEHNILSLNMNTETSTIVNNATDDSAFRNLGVKYKGSLKTYRTVMHQDGIFKIVLDKNEYLGETDYELEIEYSPNNLEQSDYAIYAIVRTLQIYNDVIDKNEFVERINKSKSKSYRFFEKYRQILAV